MRGDRPRADAEVCADLAVAAPEENWPIGVQVMAPYGDEATLLALAGDLERAVPWQDRRPGTVVG